MRGTSVKVALCSSVALGALALAPVAQAACNAVNGVVTCTGASTTNDANNAIGRTGPPSVTVVVADGATVQGGFNSQIIVNSYFRGAIGYTNRGVVGAPDRPTDFVVFGERSSAANTFTFTNTGTQNGGILALGMGGAMSGTNSGLVTRGITLSGTGPITFTNTGTVFLSNSPGQTAITLDSSNTIFTMAADGTQRFADVGGLVSATIAGRVGGLVSGGAPGNFDGVSVRGVGGADVTVTGQAGILSVNAGGYTTDSLFTFSFSPGFSYNDVSSQRSTAADGQVAIGETGSVTSLFLNATGKATAIINGTVAGGFNSVSVGSGGGESSSRQTNISSADFNSSSQSYASSFKNTGGIASVDIGATGRVLGNVTVGSSGGTATARVAGAVGDATSAGSISVRSVSNDSTSQFSSVRRADGSSDSSNSSTSRLSGGAALVTIAATGNVAGNVSVDGDASATVDNAGRIAGSVSANSARTLTTSSSSNQLQTVTNGPGGVQAYVSRNDSRQVNETLGGTARVTNAATGVIEGSVGVSGFAGATLDNAGAIRGSISLNSQGSRSTFASSGRTEQLTTFLPNGGAITTSQIQDSGSTSSSRPTGGAVTGIYGGVIGVAQPTNYYGFASIDQNATTTSAATITGTAYADFFGNAGAQSTDSSSSSASRQLTQLNGASTREHSSSFSQTNSQTASTSSLTVGATGIVADNGNGTGNVTLVSQGGDALFTLDGGRVDGSVDLYAGDGFNTVQTSNSSSSFTRAATQPNVFFTPEIQQTQISNSAFEQRAVRGAATATVTGTIGGDLFVKGTGTGAGSIAANVVVNGTVTGLVAANAFARDTRSSTNDTATRTGANTVARTVATSSSTTPSADSGNVVVAVAGIAGGGIQAAAGAGSAMVNLTGRAGSTTAGGVLVRAYDFATARDSTQTSNSTNFFSSFPLTASRVTTSSAAMGGTATLNVAPSSTLLASGASSIEGDVVVNGLAGSTMTVAAGARIVQTTGRVFVGGNLTNTTADTTGVFNGAVQTGSIGTSSGRFVGGPATLGNAGTIGSVTNAALVSVASVGGASVRNTGTINGTVVADARGANRSSTTTTTDIDNFPQRRTVTNNVITAAGGNALVDNTALVTGDITAIGATGTVTNSGVVRGAVTLGGGFVNFNTTVTTMVSPARGASVTTTTTTPAAALFTQTYRLDQNGFVLGGIDVTGTSTVDPSGGTTRTSIVNAAVNLNNGSITLGNITANRDSATNVTLNGAGFLGVATNDLPNALVPGQIVTGFQPTPSLARFLALDPALANVQLPSGSRVSGVGTMTKTGDGTFVIVGAPQLTTAAGATAPTYTLDVGSLRVAGGELQLGLAGTTATAAATANSFGIRGNVENNASLVVGRRVTDGTTTAIRGINVGVGGNLTNAATGSLVVGVSPSFVRSGAGFVPIGTTGALASTNSFVRVDGNLTLAGTLAVQTAGGGIFEAGRAYDLFNVGGAYSNTGSVRTDLVSPFIGFTLTPRSEGGRTIVSLDVARANYDTVTTDSNAAAAARALQAAIPGVAAGLRAGNAGSQDLAAVIAALDTQFTAAQSAQAFRELSSGEFYGSLAAISTTVPFGEATDGLSAPGAEPGVGLWFRPTGQFATYKANEQVGASGISLDNYGGSIGLNYTTGSGGSFGVAGGYSALNVRAKGTPERAEAKTYMVGGYFAQEFGALHASGQAVYGWTDWDVSRGLPSFARTATGSFKSNELRASLRLAYAIELDRRIALTPFARGEMRYFRFDGFSERGAASIGLAVDRRSRSVFSPEVGLRLEGTTDNGGRIRPFAEGSYVFQGEVGTDRTMSFLGNPPTRFTVTGVNPGDHIDAAVGVSADVGRASVFLRGDYASGGSQQVGSVRGGALIRF